MKALRSIRDGLSLYFMSNIYLFFPLGFFIILAVVVFKSVSNFSGGVMFILSICSSIFSSNSICTEGMGSLLLLIGLSAVFYAIAYFLTRMIFLRVKIIPNVLYTLLLLYIPTIVFVFLFYNSLDTQNEYLIDGYLLIWAVSIFATSFINAFYCYKKEDGWKLELKSKAALLKKTWDV